MVAALEDGGRSNIFGFFQPFHRSTIQKWGAAKADGKNVRPLPSYSPPLLWAEIQIEKDRTGDTGQTPDRQTPDKGHRTDTGQTDTEQTPDADELKFDKNAIQKIMKYH